MKIIKSLKKYDWLLIVLSMLYIFMQVWLDLKIPEYMREIMFKIQAPTSTIKDLLYDGGLMIGCAIGSLFASMLVAIFSSKIASNFSYNLRNSIYDKVNDFSKENINKFKTSTLINRTTADVTELRNFIVTGLQVAVKAPIMIVWAILKISKSHKTWTISTVAAVLVLVLVVAMSMSIALPLFKKVISLKDGINNKLQESLHGLLVIRAYNAESFQENKFDAVNKDLTKNIKKTNLITAFISPTISGVLNGLVLAIYWTGAIIINNASTQLNKAVLFSDMMAFSAYSIQIVMSFMMVVFIFVMFPRMFVSFKRVKEILKEKPTLTYSNNAKETKSTGSLEFKNVFFMYKGLKENILSKLNFKINKGETVAIIGPTGSGKTTILSLMARFYDPTQGEVLLDGINIKDYPKEIVNKKIGYVLQKPFIFSGSIKSNINIDNNEKLADEKINQFLKMAKAFSFVNELPEKLNSFVSQKGKNFSGGQKQRLSIARALAKSPEILLFDDSFSALDYKTEKELKKELNIKLKEVTKVIVAQRVATIKEADQIIVVEEGNIRAIGKHSELLKNCSLYKEIALSQLSKEEL